MGLNERILTFISHLEVNVAEFERNCNLSNGSVSKMGDNTRRSTLEKISKIYPSLNLNWLLTGLSILTSIGTYKPIYVYKTALYK